MKIGIKYKNLNYSIKTHGVEDLLTSYLIRDNVWEPKLTDIIIDNIKDGDIFIDIGSHVGVHSKSALEMGAIVYAFEPIPINYNLLKENLSSNNARLYNVAVGKKNGTIKLDLNSETNTGDFIISEKGNIVSNIITLNSISKDIKFSKVKIIKIDVQGYELDVIAGATDLLDNILPGTFVLVEVTLKTIKHREKEFYNFIKRFSDYYVIPTWDNNEYSFKFGLRELIRNHQEEYFDMVLIK